MAAITKKTAVEMNERNKAYPVQFYDSSASEEVTNFHALGALSSTDDKDIYVSTTGTYGVTFGIPERDDKYLLLIKTRATSAKTIYVKKGDNPSYGAGVDLKIELPIGAAGAASTSTISSYGTEVLVALTLDSSKYVQWKAENPRKGQIVILGADNSVSVALVRLP